jgi:hypothetical protein
LLPEELKPTVHINYENRLLDMLDSLPKFVAFPGAEKVNNDGTPLTA